MWAQRVHRGHASAGTDARIDGIVAVRVKHVIDRGRGRCTVHKGASLDAKERRGRVKKNNSPRCTVITHKYQWCYQEALHKRELSVNCLENNCF
jgi:hypothetical protein